jgi:hypothetical protein
MSPNQKLGMLYPRNERNVPALSNALYFFIAEYMPRGMAIMTVNIKEAPISRTVGHTRGAMIEVTGAFCLKLSPKSPWSMSPIQMPYWT